MNAIRTTVWYALLLIGLQQIDAKSGPYTVKITEVWPCDDQGENTWKINIQKYLTKVNGQKKLLHRGSFIFPYSEDQLGSLEVHGDFYQKKTNDYLFMYKFDGEFCDTITKIASRLYRSLRKNIGIEEDGCGMEAGKNNTIQDWDVPFDLPTPMLEYGVYKISIQLLFEKKLVACFEALGDVQEKFA